MDCGAAGLDCHVAPLLAMTDAPGAEEEDGELPPEAASPIFHHCLNGNEGWFEPMFHQGRNGRASGVFTLDGSPTFHHGKNGSVAGGGVLAVSPMFPLAS